MATTAKAPNYSTEQEQIMREAYEAANNDDARSQVVENLAEQFGKKVQSIRAKLVRMEIYIKKTPTNKTGGAIQKKEAIVTAIGEYIDLNEAEATSMGKVNKGALQKILAAVTPPADETEAETES